MEAKQLAIEFLKWVNEPIGLKQIGAYVKCVPQAPEYNVYVIIGPDGYRASPYGVFYTEDELFEMFIKEKGIILTT
jgi:hypothetical protein